MHARSSGLANMTRPLQVPAPSDTADGFRRMTYEQRADLYRRDVALYRQLADVEAAELDATLGAAR